MPLLGLNVAFTDHAKDPALRNALKACEQDRLNDAFDIIRTVEEELMQELAATQDLFALIQATRGFVDDALADAIETFQNFPHLALGYNRASEMYMRKGQGLCATEVYEAGLKAFSEKGDPQQMSFLQKHRHEMELKYRDFIGLLPLDITERIFQEFDHNFRLHTCSTVSAAWLPKAVHKMSIAKVGEHSWGLDPIAAGRLSSYIDTIEIKPAHIDYLAEFFGGLKEEGRPIGSFKRLTINAFDSAHIGLQKIILDGVRRIPQSLTSLTVISIELIPPLDLLASCPNLTMLHCTYNSYTAPLIQTEIPQRDKLTRLEIVRRDGNSSFVSEDLQRIIKATPNVCFAKIPKTTSRVFDFVRQHWRRVQVLYMNPSPYDTPEYEIPDNEEYLKVQYCGCDMVGIYEYICQERTRLQSLFLTPKLDMEPFEGNPVQFPVLEYLHIDMYGVSKPSIFPGLELLQGAVMLEELFLLCTNAYPETFEALTQLPKLKRLMLHVPFTQGISLYLEHLASLGSESPLESIVIHDQSLDDNQRAILSTRIPSLKDITIFTHIIKRCFDDSWIIPFLDGLVQSKSMVETISIPDYAMTERVQRAISNLAALHNLDVVTCSHAVEYEPREEDYIIIRSTAPSIHVNFTYADDLGANIYYDLEHTGLV